MLIIQTISRIYRREKVIIRVKHTSGAFLVFLCMANQPRVDGGRQRPHVRPPRGARILPCLLHGSLRPARTGRKGGLAGRVPEAHVPAPSFTEEPELNIAKGVATVSYALNLNGGRTYSYLRKDNRQDGYSSKQS